MNQSASTDVLSSRPTGLLAPFPIRSRPMLPGLHGQWALVSGRTLAFLALHVPLAIAMHRTPTIATGHALICLAAGVWWAVTGRLDRVIHVVAYITGAEVLWRMTEADIYWEFGKYASSAILVLALLRHRRLRCPMLPFLYFVALLPSVTLTLQALDISGAREQLSFNLSGPLALTLSAWFFSQVEVSKEGMRRMLVALIGPVIGIAAVALLSTMTTSDILFYDGSNITTSGGFGPNQVSAALGLGALLCLFLVLDRWIGLGLKVAMFGIMLVLTVQSALTFSRGGLYTAIGAAVFASLFLLKDSNARVKLIPTVALLFFVANYFLVPYLEGLTDGAISTRFRDTNLTGRDQLIRADLAVWKENPIWGVGPGEAQSYRGAYLRHFASGPFAGRRVDRPVAAHTEFSRLLAEHGVFGLCALVLLVTAAVQNIRRPRSAEGRALVAGVTGWSCLFMLTTAMRLMAPSLFFGMAFAKLFPESEPVRAGRSLVDSGHHGEQSNQLGRV